MYYMFTFIVLVIALAFYLIFIYNNLVSNKQLVNEGWSGIEIQLKRRSSLIPNLLETVKGYMQHEKGVLEEVTKLRSNVQRLAPGDVKNRIEAETGLSGALGKLFMVAENYPELKANKTFLTLHKSLSDLEDELQMSRRYYNGTVRNLNVLVDSFPSNIVARLFYFVKFEYFEVDNEADRALPKIDFSVK